MTQPTPHVADPYRTLGLRRAATAAEIKAAHRTLAKRFHPDTDGGDTRRFLRIQEAYRVLSNPLLRREWDARHAPGPIRADRGERPARPTRARPAAKATTAEPAESPPRPADPRREPRSSRAYTWSATEVPWWEEGVQRDARRRSREPAAPPPGEPGESGPGQPAAPTDGPNEFDVYNRSSGAAWSMAARAYFRRGEQDLPRRGSFHHQGSQPLTAARARTAAEQERRRAARQAAGAAAAAAGAAAAGAAQSTQSAPPKQPHANAAPQGAAAPTAAASTAGASTAASARQSRDRIVSRALPRIWPSVAQRMVYALIAWLPFAAAIILASSARIDEVMQTAMMVLVLGLLALVPRLAYVLAVATLGMLVVGFFFVVALAWLGFPLPLSTAMTAAVGAALALGYVATAGIVALGPAALRPWARQPEHVRSR